MLQVQKVVKIGIEELYSIIYIGGSFPQSEEEMNLMETEVGLFYAEYTKTVFDDKFPIMFEALQLEALDFDVIEVQA